MKKSRRWYIRLFLWALFFLLPVLVMQNCSGWNEGSMKVLACKVNFPLSKELASLVYAFLLTASFSAGVTLLIYIAVVEIWIRFVIYFCAPTEE